MPPEEFQPHLISQPAAGPCLALGWGSALSPFNPSEPGQPQPCPPPSAVPGQHRGTSSPNRFIPTWQPSPRRWQRCRRGHTRGTLQHPGVSSGTGTLLHRCCCTAAAPAPLLLLLCCCTAAAAPLLPERLQSSPSPDRSRSPPAPRFIDELTDEAAGAGTEWPCPITCGATRDTPGTKLAPGRTLRPRWFGVMGSPAPELCPRVSLPRTMTLGEQLKHLPTLGKGLPSSLLVFQLHLGVTPTEPE